MHNLEILCKLEIPCITWSNMKGDYSTLMWEYAFISIHPSIHIHPSCDGNNDGISNNLNICFEYSTANEGYGYSSNTNIVEFDI